MSEKEEGGGNFGLESRLRKLIRTCKNSRGIENRDLENSRDKERRRAVGMSEGGGKLVLGDVK